MNGLEKKTQSASGEVKVTKAGAPPKRDLKINKYIVRIIIVERKSKKEKNTPQVFTSEDEIKIKCLKETLLT